MCTWWQRIRTRIFHPEKCATPRNPCVRNSGDLRGSSALFPKFDSMRTAASGPLFFELCRDARDKLRGRESRESADDISAGHIFDTPERFGEICGPMGRWGKEMYIEGDTDGGEDGFGSLPHAGWRRAQTDRA